MKRILVAMLVVIGATSASQLLAATLGPGDAAPSMKVFRWVKGTPVTQFAPGKLYVVEFWATWCGPCKMSIPHLTELAKKYKDKVTFAGISVSETPNQKPGGTDTSYLATVRKFVGDEGGQMGYNVGADGPTGAMSSTWMEAAGQKGIPTAFIVKNGKIAWIGHPMGGLDEALDKMLAGTFDYAGEKVRESKVAEGQATLQAYQSAMAQRDFKGAIAAVDKAMADHPEMADSLVMAKFEALARSDPPAANEYAKAAAAGDAKTNPAVLNSIAWAMIDDTDPLPGMDNSLAESIAAQAIALLKADTTEYAETLDTLALAQFKNGKRGDAIATETKAIDLYSHRKDVDADTLKEMRARLTKFQASVASK